MLQINLTRAKIVSIKRVYIEEGREREKEREVKGFRLMTMDCRGGKEKVAKW